MEGPNFVLLIVEETPTRWENSHYKKGVKKVKITPNCAIQI